MLICTFHTTDRADRDLIPAVILGSGETIDDLVPEISDEVSSEIAMDDRIGKHVEITDIEGNTIECSVFGVCAALAEGATCIILTHTLPAGDTYENVLTIHQI